MKEEGDVFKKFQESFGRVQGHYHILDQKVPVEIQMEYFRFSETLRKEHPRLAEATEEECEEMRDLLLREGVCLDEQRLLLSRLAISRQVKAYRILEAYAAQAEPEVKHWAAMALLECRISLESELSDEKQIYISTGLGGRDEKLRFFVLLLSMHGQCFEAYQKQVLEREAAYELPKAGCEIERFTMGERHAELVCLIPVRTDIKYLIDELVVECNQYGHFLSDIYTVTNMRELSQEEIADILEKHGNNQASH